MPSGGSATFPVREFTEHSVGRGVRARFVPPGLVSLACSRARRVGRWRTATASSSKANGPGTNRGPITLPDGSEVPPHRPTPAGPAGHCLRGTGEVRDGKILASGTYWDALPLMMPLGLVAPARRP